MKEAMPLVKVTVELYRLVEIPPSSEPPDDRIERYQCNHHKERGEHSFAYKPHMCSTQSEPLTFCIASK